MERAKRVKEYIGRRKESREKGVEQFIEQIKKGEGCKSKRVYT